MIRLSRDTLFDSSHLSRDLLTKSVRGGITTMTSQGLQLLLRVGGTAIIARLLTPADYGLIGMVTVIVNFAQMFKDAGLSMATVQKAHITEEQISTLFWLNVLISVILGLIVLAGSPLVALFYGRPELTTVTAALSISFIISGLTIQHQALLRRNMQFGTLANIQIVAQGISLAATFILALLGWRYWALVGGSLVNAITSTLMTAFFCPWIPGRMQRGTGVRSMLKFGSQLTAFDFMNYFSRNFDNILIGRYISAEALGLYARAYQLFMMPITQIRRPLNQVALPVLSSLRDQPDRYIKYYQRLIDMLATATIPLTLYCIIEAEFLVKILLGGQWSAVVPLFQILAIAGLIQAVAGTMGLVLVSCGFANRYLYWGLFNSILTVTSFIVGLPFGVKGVAIAYAIANYVIFVPSLFYCFRETPITVCIFMKTLITPFLAATPAVFGAILLKNVLANSSIFAHLLYAFVFLVIYIAISMFRQSVRESTGLFLKGFQLFSFNKKSSINT